jgi:hypothetical protein
MRARYAPSDIWWPLSIDLRREPAGPSAADSPLKVEPVAALRPNGADRTNASIGFALAIIAHAAVLLAFAIVGPPEPSGGGGQWLEAISVEIVMTQVIEARETRPTETSVRRAARWRRTTAIGPSRRKQLARSHCSPNRNNPSRPRR